MIGYKPYTLPSVIPDSSIPAVESYLKSLIATWEEALTAPELTH